MIRLQNVLKMFSRRICKTSWRRFEDVLKMSWRGLENVLKTSWRRLEDVLKTYGQDEYIGLDQDVLKTSSEDVWLIRIYSSSSRRLEDVLKTSFEDEDERRLHQGECLLGNIKRGAVCIYYHNFLPLKVINIQFLNEYINFEIRIGGKLCGFLCLYWSPSQTRNIFETFADNFELILDTAVNRNLFSIVALGDFNAKTANWYKNDMNLYEGLKINTITSQFGFQKLINEPIHPTANSSSWISSWINLIFISQPNLWWNLMLILPCIQIAIIR